VAEVALDLFVARGLTAVSMAEVAAAAGVSRRSLFRLFPSKAALVWAGMDEAEKRFTDAFDHRANTSDPLLRRIRRAYVDALAPLAVSPEVTRRRILLIHENSEIYASGIVLLHRFEAHLAARVAESSGDADHLAARSMAAAIAGAAFAGVVWWAQHDDRLTVAECVDAALSALSAL
jgi:AcrR family transcriptional regulator